MFRLNIDKCRSQNALIDFGLKASMPWLYNALVYLVAGCSAMALMTLMVICYLKLFHRVLIKDYSNDTGFKEAEIADGVEDSIGVVPRFMTWLNQKVDFDFLDFDPTPDQLIHYNQ